MLTNVLSLRLLTNVLVTSVQYPAFYVLVFTGPGLHTNQIATVDNYARLQVV